MNKETSATLFCPAASFWCCIMLFPFFTAAADTENAAGNSKDGLVVSSQSVLTLLEKNNLSLQSAKMDIQSANETIRAALGNYPWVFGADAGYTHSSTARGDSSYATQNRVDGGAQISKTYSLGTSIAVRTEGTLYKQNRPDALSGNQSTGAGPYGGATARFTVSQPLLRGFGKEVGEFDLRKARQSKTLAEKIAEATAQTIILDTLSAYWELWYAGRQLQINEASRDTAREQLAEIIIRVNVGDVAMVDKLSFESNLASLETAVLNAQTTYATQQIALAKQVGILAQYRYLQPDMNETLPSSSNEIDIDRLITSALAHSPSVHVALANVDVVMENEKIAGESLRQKLDVEGWLQGSTLTNDRATDLLSDFGDGSAYSAYVGLTYELPFADKKREAEHAQAKINTQQALLNVTAAKHEVIAQTQTAYQKLLGTQKRLALSEQTVVIARKEMEAQQERYRLGDAIYTEVRSAEETARNAELGVVRTQVDVILRQLELEAITGKLIQRYPSYTAFIR